MQKQRFIADLNNMENSKQIFDRQARINNINRIKREQEDLTELYNKLERKEENKKELNHIEQKIEKLQTDKEKLIAELKNTVLMSNSDRHIRNERINRIEREQEDLIQEYRKLEHKQKGEDDDDKVKKYLKGKSIPLDNSIGLGLGREKLDIHSYNERIAPLKNRYMDVSKMKRILIGLINNPNTSKCARGFYIADLKSLIDGNELEDLEDEIKLLKDAPDLDNDFKISAELQRLR
jgi:hypothetical protein